MCLILFAYNVVKDHPLLIASNRDEFYERPTKEAHSWKNTNSGIFGGKDLKEGGTWLAINNNGKLGAITNYRNGLNKKQYASSRGELIPNFLENEISSVEYAMQLTKEPEKYNGFNLLLYDGSQLCYYSNITNENKVLNQGIYGLSNAFIDTPWPKLVSAKQSFTSLIQKKSLSSSEYFDMLSNQELAPDDLLPSTNVPFEWEKLLSAIFIKMPGYGTRASTFFSLRNNGLVNFNERLFIPGSGGRFEFNNNEFKLLLKKN